MVSRADTDRHAAGRAPRRTRLPAAERRETILRAATEVFAQDGYRAGKVSDVAARVGVTEPVIFQNFGSKAALFAAVLDRAASEVRASLDEMAADFGSASGLLAHVLAGVAHEQPAHVPPVVAHGEPVQVPPGVGHGQPAQVPPLVAHGEPVQVPPGVAHGRSANAPPGVAHGQAGQGGAPGAGLGAAGDAGAVGAVAHAGAAYGVLFADAAALAAEPELAEPARNALRAVAGHLADLIRHAQADGDARRDADPEAAAWLLLSVLSARRLRAAAMPAGLEPAVTALARAALAPPAAGSTGA